MNVKQTPLWLAAQAAFIASLLGCVPTESTHGLRINQLIAKQEKLLGQKVTVEGYPRRRLNRLRGAPTLLKGPHQMSHRNWFSEDFPGTPS